ncbi:homospermidine synthase [Rhodobacter sp. TJ_12]|uniref:hydrogenase maturation protease n=1 Tax=Rhodobacter sp. TJ_12 TaxID=2029399 RepID=UPI001CC02EF8|nr:hydrogenase maturation protease [Rhodobacter sp. TJ_12]MBZ4023108.1 homospermidine synthase [Rhodobacter sp. TJ_12]
MLRGGMSPRVTVFAWGNETRGDDGLGPRLAARIAAAGWTHLTLIEEFQLQVEHALDLVGQDLILFIDAGRATPGPYVFAQTGPRRMMTHTSHGVGPETVLEAYRQVMNDAPPPAFVLCLRGESFELEELLSPQALSNLADAWGFLIPLLSSPDLAQWQAAQTGGAETIVPPAESDLRPAAE